MNTKKFRVWDNRILFNVLQDVIQLKQQIEELCEEGVHPGMLPPSVIPTNKLYDIMACYSVMYDKLLEHDLVSAGYPKSTTNQH